MNDCMMGMMNGPMMGAMMIGGGLVLLLVVTVLVLSLVALVKYLRGAR
ncbi:hypothetical protein [Pseudohoeflea coraliihabitans]|uniref:Oxaloacetate decarboxylase n=1 Tax=Pseudohoeflea coraliihabitans TaxID=2860393 RepID=A0ABS6WP51_9HYPH|nr:hypothetical protein [Pseudohoeflea sp. DP4N28-3]MBW3097741.1 hypothetical protein [Pseudohoeflea sp. DP4N28-3]